MCVAEGCQIEMYCWAGIMPYATDWELVDGARIMVI